MSDQEGKNVEQQAQEATAAVTGTADKAEKAEQAENTEKAEKEKPAPAESTEMNWTSDNAQDQVVGIFSGLGGTLGKVTDEASATEALPALTRAAADPPESSSRHEAK